MAQPVAMHVPGNPEASIYWTPETGAHPVYGAIRGRWAVRGWETSSVGYPVEAEHDRSGLPGREQNFERGRIAWSPETGAFFDPLVLSAPIVSGGLAALGGSVTVTINGDGSTRWQGHAHDSGADGYDFGITAVVRASSGQAVAFAHYGHVGGTFTSGSRNNDWDENGPVQPLVRDHLAAFNDTQLETNLGYASDIGSTLESAIAWLIKWEVGSLLGPVGAIVFVGLEIGSLVSTGSLVPGARLAEGILWMAGPANTLLAIAAEGVASLGSRTRELTDEEYNWANAEVFSGSLPPRDRIVLTDTIGGGDRAFTFPRYDGKITLNMGAGAFDDPRRYPSGVPGQVFIHELVHAWQIHHVAMELTLLADAFASKVCEATGDSPYVYGHAGPAYGDFNLEQQAQVVSDWFAGSKVPEGTNHTGTPKDVSSPYFRYINENIRTGTY
ncbi:LGFP repeat-containing protein [Streptomyces sp. NPDC002742]|uniref:LGFP repeat-containing protein n=1 Tax=Streptomyces sp. NPDC002742 TaxID=3364663 RepID=UPI0036BEBD70